MSVAVRRETLLYESRLVYADVGRIDLGPERLGFAAIHVQVRRGEVGLRHTVVVHGDDGIAEARLVVCDERKCLEVGG